MVGASKKSLNAPNPINTDSLFIAWNKATFLSLERQSNSLITDSSKRDFYANRIAALKAYLKIESVEANNSKSNRYTFLKLLSLKEKPPFYVVEANESGQRILIRNFVIYREKDSLRVDFYENEKTWRKTGTVKLGNDVLQNDLKTYFTQKGFNYDDIIVTKFREGVVVESEYFLFGTLSKSSGVNEVLASYKKENFIK
jgi:hypothetical protein